MGSRRLRCTARLFAPVLAGLLAHASHAQLEKLYVEGRLVDANSGAPLINARMMVTDSLDEKFTFRSNASAQGTFSAALYSGAHYVLRFESEGHAPRCAVIDLRADRDWPDVSRVWRIRMEVPLQALEDGGGSVAGCEWKCVYKPRTDQLEWLGDEAREKFPITREANERTPEEVEMRYARTDNRFLLMKGYVRDLYDEHALSGARITFMPENGRDSTLVADGMGYYELKMTFDQTFRVRYSADGRVSKIVEVDPTGVPEKERKQGFVVWTDMTLFAPIPGADFSFLDEPIGKAAYDAKGGIVTWDMDYSLPIMERLNAILEGR